MGINAESVLDKVWWPKYCALIREANRQNIKVILAYWESKSNKNGKIHDEDSFHRMWHEVIREFIDQHDVFFEIFNEPYGYSDAEWRDIAHHWMQRHARNSDSPERTRILVSGSGYNENLNGVSCDPRFEGCRLSFHLYSWFGGKHKTADAWKQELRQRIGAKNASRTIVTEWGVPMQNKSADFYSSQSTLTTDQAFAKAMTEVIFEERMGSCYWPGLRDGDDFSLLERMNDTTHLRLINDSGRSLLLNSFSGAVT